MLFNPVIMILLAGISLLVGTVALIQTESWLCIVPFVVFTVLFCLSLFLPVTKRIAIQQERWVAPKAKPRKQLIKLTADRLRALSEATERPGSTASQT